MSANHYDVIIIGSGAGGGTLAYRLAPSGKKILLLERGDFVPREKQNWDSRAVIGEGRYNNVEPWRDPKGKEFVPGAHYFVGGNTKFYGGSTIAFQDRRSMAEVQPTNGQDIHHRPTETDWDLPQLPAGRFRCLRIRKSIRNNVRSVPQKRLRLEL
jgi:choline dehydrogenase-like flavoprotein